ncbi:hypothetical protein DFH27DRAFT_207143 [Peziza echinospora]|nr:hypothetical protein DFH27DRAFT_207143 [Peziza echinospora]
MAAYLSAYVLAPLVKEAISATGLTTSTGNDLKNTLGDAQRVLRSAEDAAKQVKALIDNPGVGLSGQPTIPREKFTRELSSFYQKIFPNHHILVLYDRLPRFLYIHGVIGPDGRIHDGPSAGDVVTAHKKIQRGYLKAGLWGFHLYVFREGRLKNLGDGGFSNWAWASANFKREGKEVEFLRIEPAQEGEK